MSNDSQTIFDILGFNNIFYMPEPRYYACSLKGSNLHCRQTYKGFVTVPASVPRCDDAAWLSTAFEAPVTISTSVPWHRRIYQANK